MIEVLTLIIGIGLGYFIKHLSNKIYFSKDYKNWKIRCFEGETKYYIWAKSDTEDVYVGLDSNGEIIINYDTKPKK